jgi:chemosensory pili system protein ChpA (sensor histidine kinase/response regulator)
MCVDDHAFLVEGLRTRLKLEPDIEFVGWLSSAKELIAEAERTRADIVLLDIEMPRMDGYEFLSTVRSQKGRADLPIVMLTSRSSDKHRDKATALGVTDYMVKPFQEDTLVSNIDRLVKASRAQDKAAS